MPKKVLESDLKTLLAGIEIDLRRFKLTLVEHTQN